MREVTGRELLPGMRLALPFGREATIATVDVGRRYVRLRYLEEDTPNGRVEVNQPVLLVDDPEPGESAADEYVIRYRYRDEVGLVDVRGVRLFARAEADREAETFRAGNPDTAYTVCRLTEEPGA